jgi:RimJ/RimL family protein N-acetyltransferase
MARLLIERAHATDPAIEITAQTLPEENASTAILRKLGFQQSGTATDDEVGLVWEWRRGAARQGEQS